MTLRSSQESVVKKAVIEEFVPRFAAQSTLLHLRNPYPFRSSSWEERLEGIGISRPAFNSLPDLVLLDDKREWVFFVEAVHSFGPITPARLETLEALCAGCRLSPVFVSAFFDRDSFRKFALSIAWDTTVWIAQEPDHTIHFDGGHFLGPRATSFRESPCFSSPKHAVSFGDALLKPPAELY